MTEKTTKTLWIWKDNEEMIEKTITFVPLLYQMFDEILISAADIKGVKHILVNINVEDNKISVWAHGGEGVHDISYSIISEAPGFASVSVIKGDANGVSEEVSKIMGEKLEKVHISDNWCLVSFTPDLAQFGMDSLELHDMADLMKRRVVDLAGCSSSRVKVQVLLDGTPSLPRTFEEYVELYIEASGASDPTMIYEKLNDGCEICVATSDLELERFDQVTFVNNIPTLEVGNISSNIACYLATIYNLEPNVLEKSFLWVFVNAHIPAFNSHTTKEELLTFQSTSELAPKFELTFDSICQLTPEFMKKIAESVEDFESLEEYGNYIYDW